MLTKENPLERLEEFCSPSYVYNFTFKQLGEGVLCRLEVDLQEYYLDEVRYVNTKDFDYAKNVVAAVLLERIGLGVPQPEETPVVEQENVAEQDPVNVEENFAEEAFRKIISLTTGVLNDMASTFDTSEK